MHPHAQSQDHMPGHDSKGSVEQDWAALGAELEAKSTSKGIPNDCWSTPEDGWAALGASLEATAKSKASATSESPADIGESKASGRSAEVADIPTFEEFQRSSSVQNAAVVNVREANDLQARGGVMSFEQFTAAASGVCYTPKSDTTESDIPSFEEFKAANAAKQAGGRSDLDDPDFVAMRNRDPATIENGWAALGAELDNADPTHNSVEDGWAALGAELEARQPATWAELGAARDVQARKK